MLFCPPPHKKVQHKQNYLKQKIVAKHARKNKERKTNENNNAQVACVFMCDFWSWQKTGKK